MNYIEAINRFWDAAMLNPLPTGQVSLYMALLHINNRSNWAEWFAAPNQVLSVLTGLSRSGILKARNGLKQGGWIDVRDRGTKAAQYCLMLNSKQVGVQDGMQTSVQNSMQDGMQNSGTYKNINRNSKQNDPPVSPADRFGEFAAAYPKPGAGSYAAGVEYVNALRMGVAEGDLIQAAKNYAEACGILETEEQFMLNAENFLRRVAFDTYLPGKYKKPARKAKGSAEKYNAGIMQNSYDFDRLEEALLR